MSHGATSPPRSPLNPFADKCAVSGEHPDEPRLEMAASVGCRAPTIAPAPEVNGPVSAVISTKGSDAGGGTTSGE